VRDFLAGVKNSLHLNHEQLYDISMNMEFVEFDDGDTIITQGEKGNTFYIIVKDKKIMKYFF
jgi:CRP-like cAMP-binding protein